MGQGADGACSRDAFIGTWGEVITAPMRRLGRPYFRVGLLLSVEIPSRERRSLFVAYGGDLGSEGEW